MEDKKCCCCERHKERSPEEYKALMNRLNRIEGQIRGIKGMVENGAYCPDILVPDTLHVTDIMVSENMLPDIQ